MRVARKIEQHVREIAIFGIESGSQVQEDRGLLELRLIAGSNVLIEDSHHGGFVRRALEGADERGSHRASNRRIVVDE